MNNWNLRKQIIAIVLLPILVVSVILTAYFTISQLNFLSESLIRHGEIITKHLAPVSEYAVFSGNIDSLIPILQNTLSDKDVVNIKITDNNNTTLISLNSNRPLKIQHSIWHQLAEEELTTFKHVITSQALNLNPLDNNDDSMSETSNTIGYVEITLTSINIDAKKFQAIAKGALITLLIIITSIILAVRLSKRISKPVKKLTDAVKKISSGNYNTRIDQQAQGELGVLETCVNIMAEKLQASHENLESKIDESTKELHETMEELEIRNIQLDLARANAIQASHEKTMFLANMSHELRTPLGGILGFSELLEGTDLEPHQRDYSETIKKSADNLLQIINNVLDLSKIESGKLDIQLSEFNIVDIVEDVINLLIPIAYEKNLELFYYIDKKTPHTINSDSARIRQILINLIGNAIKFTEKGFISLYISSSQDDDTSTNFTFSVQDTGIGMNLIQQERLFSTFTQADKSIEKKFGGTGLGLVISKKLAQLLHGNINFRSELNKGSLFKLEISVKNIPQENNDRDSLEEKRICFISADTACQKGIQSIFDFWGCQVSNHQVIPLDLSNYDLIVSNIDRISMHDEKIKSLTPSNKAGIPTLAIISTRSHQKLSEIKNYGFNEAIFRSSKQSFIRQIISDLANKISRHDESKDLKQKSEFDWSGLNVLVVDDNDINLKLAEIILTKNGALVVTEETGKGGIEQTRKRKFDLIFMDLQMPDLDGYETSTIIREDDKNTIIIALTANAMATKESSKIEQCGMNDILIKPINEISVQNTINTWLFDKKILIKEREEKKEAGFFSTAEAMELAAGNAELANELTDMLLNELPDHLQAITHALDDNNIEELGQRTHKLHGAARCCGAVALREAAAQLESNIESDTLENIKLKTQHLCNEITKLMEADRNDFML